MAASDKATAKKQKKENRFVRIGKRLKKSFSEIRIELKRVTWPTWKELFNYTITVLCVCIIMGILIYILDVGLRQLLLVTLDIGA